MFSIISEVLELSTLMYSAVQGGPMHHIVLHTPFFNDCKYIPADQNEAGQPVIGRAIIHDRVRMKFFSYLTSNAYH